MNQYRIVFDGEDAHEAAQGLVRFVAEHDDDQIAECMTRVLEYPVEIFDLDDGVKLSIQIVDDGVVFDLYSKNGIQLLGTEAHSKNAIYERITEGLRSCDKCGRWTDAGEYPDWIDGVCEECDPEIEIDECLDCGHASNEHEDTADAFCKEKECMCRGLSLGLIKTDMVDEDAELHEMDTLRRTKPIGYLVMRAWEEGKLRYQDAKPDLSKEALHLDLRTSIGSGIEFGYEPSTDLVRYAWRTIDGVEEDIDGFIHVLADAVGEDSPLREYIVTELTTVSATSEDDAIERVVNRIGNQEVVAQEAELTDDELLEYPRPDPLPMGVKQAEEKNDDDQG